MSAPGPQLPVISTPRRATGSMRRTTSLDITRPDGLLGRVVADIRGQDVRTDAEGLAHVVDRLAVAIEIDLRRGAVVAVSGLSAGLLGDLVGAGVRSGWGRRLAELFADDAARRSLLYSALDDLGGALLVSGYSLLRAGLLAGAREEGEQRAEAQGDICIAWARGGPVHETLRRTGEPGVPMGPTAPPDDADDLLGWHPMAPLATGTVRRRRRLDVVALRAQAHFRDSYAGGDGEMVMHEYLVDARVDAGGRLAEVDVDPRVLPWEACPGAAASAQRLVGVEVDDLPARVRAELVGATTCTHLNSTMRSLADVRALEGGT